MIQVNKALLHHKRGRGQETRQHKHMALSKGHVLAHKTWVCHDPTSRLGKESRTRMQNRDCSTNAFVI